MMGIRCMISPDMAKRLKEYEAIGLTPDEIKQALAELDRMKRFEPDDMYPLPLYG